MSRPRAHRLAAIDGRRLFAAAIVVMTVLAAAPFWRTRILPMQDYPELLLFARAWGDLKDPASPFFGAYARGFALSPLLLPILLLRGLGALVGLEQAGRVLWTLTTAGLPLAALWLLRVLRRDVRAVVLVFPIAVSYWVVGGFFAYATGAPLFVIGLALAVRWFEAPTLARGAALALMVLALHLWHSLWFAQLLFDVGVLWALFKFGSARARAIALAPLVPGIAAFAAWMGSTFVGRPPGSRPPAWPPFVDNADHFLDFVGPGLPKSSFVLVGLVALLLGCSLLQKQDLRDPRFCIRNPILLLSLLALISYLVFPSTCFGVEGINNRQPFVAALLFAIGWTLPSRNAARAAVVSIVAAVGAVALLEAQEAFAAFGAETDGASRLIDRLAPGDTLLAPTRGNAATFPGKPLIGLELYASIRKGGLPNASFAGYDMNIVRYANGKNPMPGLGAGWLSSPLLTKFDYVLLRAPPADVLKSSRLREVGVEGEFHLFAVCGSRAKPVCR